MSHASYHRHASAEHVFLMLAREVFVRVRDGRITPGGPDSGVIRQGVGADVTSALPASKDTTSGCCD